MCERWVETGTDCYIDPSFPLDHSSISFSSWLGCSTIGPEGSALSQQTGSHAGIPVPFLNVHLLPLFFGLFTQVHLLIDGSVEGQYITVSQLFNFPRYARCSKQESKPSWLCASGIFDRAATSKLGVSEGIFTHMYHFYSVYMYTFNGYWVLNSLEDLCITLVVLFTQPLHSGRIWHKVNF